MKTHVIALVALLSFSSVAQAQDFNFDFGFALGTPQGSFLQSLERNSYGVDLAATYRVPYTPVHLGFGMVYQNFGWSERDEFFSPNIQEVLVRVRTTNNMITPHFLVRFEPRMGAISPFVEGLVGFNYLYTQSSVLDDWGNEEIATSVNYDSFTYSHGIGGGIKFNLYEGFDGDGDFFGVALIVKAKYMLGGEADYLREGDLVRTRRGMDYSINRSRTDLNTFNVGFVFNF